MIATEKNLLRKLVLYPTELRGQRRLVIFELILRITKKLQQFLAISSEFCRFPANSRGKHGESL